MCGILVPKKAAEKLGILFVNLPYHGHVIPTIGLLQELIKAGHRVTDLMPCDREERMERYRIFGFGLWAVCLKETGELIGDCGLTMQLIGGQIRPEIGYHIRPDHQRKGYGKEAAIAVRDWTFRNTPFNMVYSYMKHTNEPSSRTAMAYGCKQVDEFADEVNEITKVFAISREEWEEHT